MARLNVAPTKSNLLMVKEQLTVAADGYELLEQKREILVMDLMRMVEKVKLLEREIEKQINKAYPALKSMLMAVGGDRVERLASGVKYDFKILQKPVVVSGMNFSSIEVDLPKQELFYSSLDSFADSDKVMVEFLPQCPLPAYLETNALANEVRKTQRRVNALDKMVIPQTKETKTYIESVLEERERENVFVLKALKAKQKGGFH